MKMIMLTCLLLSTTSARQIAAATPVDWSQINKETLFHFINLLKIDTSNPPGNETQAALYLRNVLTQNGIESELLGPNPDRLNLVARIKGNGSARPVLLLGHTDVVGVQRERWRHDPFAGVIENGYVYGRGAVDDKDNVVANLMMVLMLKRSGLVLNRDVIFVAESGEEGFAKEGFRYLVNHHWEKIDAEYALGEGGGGSIKDGSPYLLAVAATEKVGRGAELIARGSSGHGSMPRVDNAITHLARAVARIAEWQPPMRLNEITRAYFERVAEISDPEKARRIRDLFNPATADNAGNYFKKHQIRYNSFLRTTISPNMFNGGFRPNVIPSQATAYLDIRALPDENMTAFYQMMREVIDDPAVELIPGRQMNPSSKPSGLKTDLYRSLEAVQKRLYPEAITLPMLLTGGTDLQPLRGKGVHAYGIGPLKDMQDGEGNGAHADDERISEKALYGFVRYLWEVILDLSS
ncbi:MAG TPA: M20/M25/M40 family metallo-hydrolase [Gammaproteobacteria bacterium]|nr:M20/M25/M40 family metallo-hydrolase [Gammaproteobacteria bacterium]